MTEFLDMLQLMLTQDFILRALFVGGLLAICAALIGVSLVLKRYSMIGDGLSHVGFGALAIATAFNFAPLVVTIPVLLLAAFLLLQLSEGNKKINGDAAIALVSSSALAIGVVAASLSKGMNTDISSWLFGSILAMDNTDVWICIVVAIIVLVLFLLFYHRLFSITFDENFSKATGIKVKRYNMLLAFLTAMVIVVGMRMMGAMLISSLIIFPALTSMRLFKSFKSVVISSVIVGIICFFIGIILSFFFNLPSGATVVICHLVMFLIFSSIAFVKGKC